MNNHAPEITKENAHKTVYLADVPKTATYMDIAYFFEKNLGQQPQISIKR